MHVITKGEIWRGTVAVQEGAKRCLRIGTGRLHSSHTLLVGPQRHSLTASARRTHSLAICVCPIPRPGPWAPTPPHLHWWW